MATTTVDGIVDDIKELEACEIERVIAMITQVAREPLDLDEVTDPGEEVDANAEGCVELSELAAIERIIGDGNFLPAAFLEEGVTRQKAVARIALTSSHRGLAAGSGWGTGWLVSNDLMITNNHVMPNVSFAGKVRAEFNYQNDVSGAPQVPDAYGFDPASFFYTNAALDFTLVRVKCRTIWLPAWPILVRPTSNGEYALEPEYTPNPDDPEPDIGFGPIGGLNGGGFRGLNPKLGPNFNPRKIPRLCVAPGIRWGRLNLPSAPVRYAGGMHVNIVQHPSGRRKEVAVQENHLKHVYTNHLRYTTDTEPGSSGSPVFNNEWDLLAIHHAGGEKKNGEWINNQGVRIDRIVRDIRANVPASIRTALGL